MCKCFARYLKIFIQELHEGPVALVPPVYRYIYMVFVTVLNTSVAIETHSYYNFTGISLYRVMGQTEVKF